MTYAEFAKLTNKERTLWKRAVKEGRIAFWDGGPNPYPESSIEWDGWNWGRREEKLENK